MIMDLIEKKCVAELWPSGSSVDCIAKGVVNQAVCTAHELIKLDPGELFLYKRPLIQQNLTISNAVSYASSYSTSESDEKVKEDIDWISIQEFTPTDGINQIRDFINLWILTPATKFALIASREPEKHPPLGTRHFVDALFSKPTPKCPNPLAVAKVHFFVHLSAIMPPEYPIMVTYRFEGYKTTYYALGRRCLRSMKFQRFFIDTILQMKLTFYAEMCECRNPRVDEKMVVMKLKSNIEHDVKSATSGKKSEQVDDEVSMVTVSGKSSYQSWDQSGKKSDLSVKLSSDT